MIEAKCYYDEQTDDEKDLISAWVAFVKNQSIRINDPSISREEEEIVRLAKIFTTLLPNTAEVERDWSVPTSTLSFRIIKWEFFVLQITKNSWYLIGNHLM